MIRENGEYQDISDRPEIFDKVARISCLPGGTLASRPIRDLAKRHIGSTKKIGRVLDRLSRAVPSVFFYATRPCLCGKKGCANSDYGVIGYAAVMFTEDGIPKLDYIGILRFDLVTQED